MCCTDRVIQGLGDESVGLPPKAVCRLTIHQSAYLYYSVSNSLMQKLTTFAQGSAPLDCEFTAYISRAFESRELRQPLEYMRCNASDDCTASSPVLAMAKEHTLTPD